MRLPQLLAASAFVAACVSLLPADDTKPAAADEAKPLFDGKTLAGWVNVNCHPDTFAAKGGEIVTTGNPTGFLRTDRQYENFELDFDWMHVEKEKMANSGLFVWGDPLPAVGTGYTRGIEVQVLINYAPKDGWATSHGDIFSIWGAKCVPDRVHPVNPKMERCLPSENRVKGGGEWNHYKVIANDGAIKLHVNGKEVSGVSKCNPRKGYLALESEGAECHFKNLMLKELPNTNPKPDECAKVAEGHVSLFNGVDLTGWTTEKGAWKANDGVLKCTGKAELATEKEFGRYELLFDWKLPAKSDASLVVQPSPGIRLGFKPGDGFDAAGRVGGLWTAVGERTALRDALKPGAWARGSIRFDGTVLEVAVNGETQAAFKASRAVATNAFTFFPAEGVEIMNVFVRELKEEKK